MQIFKTFLCFIFFIVLAYSCEPEELPADLSTASANEINPGTDPGTDSGHSEENGDDEDEVEDGPQ